MTRPPRSKPARPKPTATLKDVAAETGVHFSTVSRALNPATRALVNGEIAQRIAAAAKRLGYRPNSLASSLRTKRSRAVGVIVPDISSLLFPPILDGIEETLLHDGYMTILANSANDQDRYRRILAGMSERQVDGLIVASATLRDAVLDGWANHPAPLVLINRTDDTGRFPSVLNDDIRGIALAMQHLHGLGHRHIAHIAGPADLSTGETRRRGFLLAAQELKLPKGNTPIVQATEFSRSAGRAACLDLLAKHSGTTAIVAGNDLIALGCYDALAERRLVCPRDMSITGYNDAPFMDLVQPPLTTVQLNQRDMGREAARILIAQMAGQETVADILLRPRLIQRQSTAPPRQ